MTGGLGNQLFKIFHGVKLSEIFNEDFVLDNTWYRDSRDRRNLVSSREYDLNFFPKIRDLDYLTWKSSSAHRRFGQLMRRSHPWIQSKVGYMVENNRQAFLKTMTPPRFVDGSFESTEFLPSKRTILELISGVSESTWISSRISELQTSGPVAIHVRRGDFTRLPHMYDIVSPDYYRRALQASIMNFGERPIHLFSDDPTEAIKFLGDGFKIQEAVLQKRETQTAEVFHLLTNYPIIIGANSTFSWWAGYLSHLKGNSLFCSMPERFLGPGFQDPSIKLRYPGVSIFPN